LNNFIFQGIGNEPEDAAAKMFSRLWDETDTGNKGNFTANSFNSTDYKKLRGAGVERHEDAQKMYRDEKARIPNFSPTRASGTGVLEEAGAEIGIGRDTIGGGTSSNPMLNTTQGKLNIAKSTTQQARRSSKNLDGAKSPIRSLPGRCRLLPNDKRYKGAAQAFGARERL